MRNPPYFSTFHRTASIVICLALAGCNEDADGGPKVTVEGQVKGSSLGDAPPALAVHRLANTQLSTDGERLELYFGEDFLSSCPDIFEPVEDVTTLAFSLNAKHLAPGSYPLCAGRCSGNYLEATFDVWRFPSGDTARPVAGAAELQSFADGRAVGTFTLEFEDGTVTGDFDLAVDCVDRRPSF